MRLVRLNLNRTHASTASSNTRLRPILLIDSLRHLLLLLQLSQVRFKTVLYFGTLVVFLEQCHPICAISSTHGSFLEGTSALSLLLAGRQIVHGIIIDRQDL